MKKFRKSHQITIYIVLGILLAWGIVFLWQANKSPLEHKAVPIALNGVLDLTNWDLEEDGIVNLNGEWEFYWHQLLSSSDYAEGIEPNKKQVVTVPDVWTDYAQDGGKLPGEGFATYRLKVITPGYAGRLRPC